MKQVSRLCAAVFSLAIVSLAFEPASAATYPFTYTDTLGDSATINFTTNNNISTSGALVTNITGTGMFDPTNAQSNSQYTIGGPIALSGTDNLLFSTSPYVDAAGIGVSITGLGGTFDYILRSSGIASCNSEAGCSLLAGAGFTLTPGAVTPTVPLPGALPLFATGLGALGLLGWRRKRKLAA
jgi:hypothetical protein